MLERIRRFDPWAIATEFLDENPEWIKVTLDDGICYAVTQGALREAEDGFEQRIYDQMRDTRGQCGAITPDSFQEYLRGLANNGN